MATVLVDYENVVASNGLKGVDVLREDDTLIIFYSNSCGKIRYDYMQSIRDSGCHFQIRKLKNLGKNALDFYIAAECGILGSLGEKQIAIISNDKGFQAVIDYFKVNESMMDVHIVKANNLENAFLLLNESEDAERKLKLKMRSKMMDLESEYALIMKRDSVRKNLKNVFLGTEYEGRLPEIIEFLETHSDVGRKALYTGFLHKFGRVIGTKMYRICSNIENENGYPVLTDVVR